MEAKPDFKIHVVIVSHDPGLWFDEMLESIAAQDHPLVDVTVVDTGSEADPTARVRRFLPLASVRCLGHNPGFGPAANQVLLDAGPVPDFFVFCHDDVALAPDTLRLLVHEAVRSNAGIVGPKYVDWDDPTRIRQIGLLVDKTGVPAPTVEIGELDQEQHDVVQDMFAVPGGCVLVRGDLFRAIGGFDPEMSFLLRARRSVLAGPNRGGPGVGGSCGDGAPSPAAGRAHSSTPDRWAVAPSSGTDSAVGVRDLALSAGHSPGGAAVGD